MEHLALRDVKGLRAACMPAAAQLSMMSSTASPFQVNLPAGAAGGHGITFGGFVQELRFTGPHHSQNRGSSSGGGGGSSGGGAAPPAAPPDDAALTADWAPLGRLRCLHTFSLLCDAAAALAAVRSLVAGMSPVKCLEVLAAGFTEANLGVLGDAVLSLRCLTSLTLELTYHAQQPPACARHTHHGGSNDGGSIGGGSSGGGHNSTVKPDALNAAELLEQKLQQELLNATLDLLVMPAPHFCGG